MSSSLVARFGVLSLALSTVAYAVNDVCDAFGELQGDLSVSDAESSVTGARARDMAAHALLMMDFNGDAVDDLVVGVPRDDSAGAGAGAVYVFFGPIGAGVQADPSAADVAILGEGADDGVGYDLADAGDLDGDGYDDLVIGMWPSAGSSRAAGVAYVVRGGSVHLGTVDLAVDSDARLFGAGLLGAEFGSVVHGVGDVNDDGYDDLLVAAPFSTEGGRAYLVAGPVGGDLDVETEALAVFSSSRPAASFGVGLARMGDVTGDGVADVVIGAPRHDLGGPLAGAVFVFEGAATLAGDYTDLDAVASFEGMPYERTGASLAPAGDLDEDGAQDLWIGSKQATLSKRGAVDLVFGGHVGAHPVSAVSNTRFLGEDSNDLAGSSVLSLADFNGDREVDLLIGGERADGAAVQSGAAWVVHGPLSNRGLVNLADADAKILGGAYQDLTGSAIAAGGDLNGDGFDDAVVGAPMATVGGLARAGRAMIYLGGVDASDEITWYADIDGDGFGNPNATRVACDQPTGYVDNPLDCGPTRNSQYPGAPENCSAVIDYNCDGFVGPVDNDGDGFTACEECDDGDVLVNPSALERCGDGVDNDCDGQIDDPSATDAITWLPDVDGDGYGNDALAVVACEPPPGVRVVTVGGDCNDFSTLSSPAVVEVCDLRDNDCDGIGDEPDAVDAAVWFLDGDRDGFGDPMAPVRACDPQGGYVGNAEDCDDADSEVRPGAVERCDLIDNDCDGSDYLGGPVSAAGARLRLVGESEGGRLGDAVSFLGDQDGDGSDELVMGAPRSSDGANEAGAVYVLRGGGAGGQVGLADRAIDGGGLWLSKIVGTRHGAYFGASLAHGDLNGDGVEDLVVGAYGARVPSALQGAVYVFYGPITDRDQTAEDADFIVKGQAGGDELGRAVVVADVDGDGRDDLLIGAPAYDVGASADSGAAYLFYGGSLRGEVSVSTAVARFYGTAGGGAGSSLAALDLDGDGRTELVIGAPEHGAIDAGAVHLIWGRAGRFAGLLSADVTLTGVAGEDGVGVSLGVAGDVNGDGATDLLIGSRSNTAFLRYGGSRPSALSVAAAAHVQFVGADGQRLGEAVTGVGDLNGDGFDELLLSAHRDDVGGANAGAALLVYGRAEFASYENGDGLVEADRVESFGRLPAGEDFPTLSAKNLGYLEGAKLLGAGAGAQLGQSIAGGGDYDADGVPDLLVGAPRFDSAVGEVGSVHVYVAGPYGTDLSEEVGPTELTSYVLDADCDTFFDEQGATVETCPMHAPMCVDPSDLGAAFVGGAPAAEAPILDDCDDSDPAVYPGAVEITGDAIDHDCNGYLDLNQPPLLTVTLFPSQPNGADDLTAQISATDPDGDPVTTSVVWFINGAEVLSASGLTLPGELFDRGDQVRVDVTASDGRDVTGPVSASVTIGNAPPAIDSCEATPAQIGVADDVRVTAVGATDGDVGDQVSVQFQWQQRFGPVWSSIPGETLDTLQSCAERNNPGYTFNCAVGSSLRALCTPSDGLDVGEVVPSQTIVVRNTVPEVTSCRIVQGVADTTTELTAASAATDVDTQDTAVVSYLWLVNGVSTGVTGAVLPASFHEHFDVVQVRCTPTDSFGGVGTTVTSSPLTIANIPPSAPVVDLLPNQPTSADPLSVVVTAAATDTDGDAISYTYAWSVDGSPFSNPTFPSSNPNIGANSTLRAQEWSVLVTANDGYVNGGSMRDSVRIGNAPPSVDRVVLTPSADPRTDDTIVATGVGFIDNDGDAPGYVVQWYVNGAAQPTPTDPLRLTGASFRKGDEVYVTLLATDSYDTGNLVTSDTLTVVNSAPSAPRLAVTPNPPGEADDLTCTITQASVDPDTAESGDTVSYAYAWYRNSLLVAGANTATLSAAETSFGDIFYCTVLPNDGEVNGDLGTSATIAIQDLDAPPAPVVTAIDRYTNRSTVTLAGTCVSGSTQCNSVVITCNDGLGADTYNTSCTAGTFAATVALSSGLDTTCTAVCRDISNNASAASNSAVSQLCSVIDPYEGTGDYGDYAGASVDEFSTLADNGASVSWTANIVADDTEDWFRVRTSDNLAANHLALANAYRVQVDLTAGGADYSFQVYRDNPFGAAECPALPGYDAYSWDVIDAGDGQHPASGNSCAPPGLPGVEGPHTLYNLCEDFSSSYYVRVQRDFDVDCQHYSVAVSNGL